MRSAGMIIAAMRVVALWCQWRTVIAPAILGALASGCASFSDGPARLYTVQEETQLIKDNIQQINLVQYSSLDEASRKRIRNDWIGARMYAIDIQYTPYEAQLTKERQGVGFGAAASTIALTTASGLVGPVATKNVLTGLAGAVTGARAAYDSDVLLSHSVQWIQSQMEARRADISSRILNGMKLSTTDYPLAAALSDLEAYYRAGTFTGGLLATNEVIAADAQLAALQKAQEQGILDPVAPLPPPLTRRAPFAEAPVPRDIRDFQAALCLKVDGKVGPQLFKAAEDFIRGRRGAATPVTKISKNVEAELEEARDSVPDCFGKQFKNAFEVGAFGVPNEGLSASERMKELQARLGVNPATGSFNDATRAAIKKFRDDNKANKDAIPDKPDHADQMDLKLKRLIFP
jgi:peptidoglycan hydrolase-like protein with peptidoglycan-binding domain